MNKENRFSIKELVKGLAHTVELLEDKSIAKCELMKTSFGKDFASKFEKLEEFISFVLLFPSAFRIGPGIFQMIFKEIENLDLSSLQKITPKIDEIEFDETAPVVGALMNHFTEKIREIDENQKKGLIKSKEGKVTIDEIVPRILDYYVLTLYAYFDVYVEETKEYLRKESIFEEEINRIPSRRNPKQVLKEILQVIAVKELNLNNYLNELIKELKWEYLYQAAHELIKLRNKIAHGETLTTINKLSKLFSKEYKKAVVEKNKVLKKWESAQAPTELFNIMKPASEDIGTIRLFRELGSILFRYLICVDHLLYLYKSMDQ